MQPAEERRQLLGRAHEERAELERLLRRRLDAVEAEQLGRVLDLVRHLVDRERERDEVLAVVRGHELGVDAAQRLHHDAIAFVLELLHVILADARRGVFAEPPLDRFRSRHRVLAGTREQLEHLAAPRPEAEAQLEDPLNRPVAGGCDRRGGGDREDPGEDHVAGDAPAHRR